MMSKAWWALTAIALVGCGGGGTDPLTVDTSRVAEYASHLALFSPTDPGTGMDPFGPVPTEQPETTGLVLKAEALRLRATHSDDARQRVQNAIDRLQATSDLDGNGVLGWGLGDAWDAFGDGSTNPANWTYTVTTAIVLDGLIEAYENRSWIDPKYGPILSDLILGSTQAIADNAWSERGSGGYFWYSPSPSDNHLVPNVSAYFTGELARVVRNFRSVLGPAKSTEYSEKVRKAISTIGEVMRMVDDAPIWYYWEGAPTDPQDLVHQGYTLLGLQQAHDALGEPLPFTAAQATKGITSYLKDGLAYEYPQNTTYSDPLFATRPARSWGPGYVLYPLTEINGKTSVEPWVTNLKTRYGRYPDVLWFATDYLPGQPQDYYPRIGAHILLGLASAAYDQD